MLSMTQQGLFCQAGNFYIDATRGVENAIITHAHSDHARRGSQKYYCVKSGLSLLRARVGKNINAQSFSYGEEFSLNGVKISFHPAGHILGSSQVRLEQDNEVWVVSGDYKRDSDPTCEPFQAVECDVFVTEATFGTPSFCWNKNADVGKEIFEWWTENSKRKINSVLFAYSLGKTQRILGELSRYSTKPIFCHPAANVLNECYRSEGVRLAPTHCLTKIDAKQKFVGELFLVPQSFLETDQAQILGENFQTAFASGWMAQSSLGYDKGFLMSDHADWNDLIKTVTETKAKRIYVQHRGKGALVRHLKSLGIEAYPDSALGISDQCQMALF